MQIRYHKNFEKRFIRLSPHLKQKVLLTVEKFSKNPFEKTLYNHPLTGKLTGKRAIAVTRSIRIIFEEYERYTLVIMLDCGTHPQVYN